MFSDPNNLSTLYRFLVNCLNTFRPSGYSWMFSSVLPNRSNYELKCIHFLILIKATYWLDISSISNDFGQDLISISILYQFNHSTNYNLVLVLQVQECKSQLHSNTFYFTEYSWQEVHTDRSPPEVQWSDKLMPFN